MFNVLGETLARLHQDEEAERWYRAALRAQPDHVPAHITYGKLLAKNVSLPKCANTIISVAVPYNPKPTVMPRPTPGKSIMEPYLTYIGYNSVQFPISNAIFTRNLDLHS